MPNESFTNVRHPFLDGLMISLQSWSGPYDVRNKKRMYRKASKHDHTVTNTSTLRALDDFKAPFRDELMCREMRVPSCNISKDVRSTITFLKGIASANYSNSPLTGALLLSVLLQVLSPRQRQRRHPGQRDRAKQALDNRNSHFE
jgi:hypothetical protein